MVNPLRGASCKNYSHFFSGRIKSANLPFNKDGSYSSKSRNWILQDKNWNSKNVHGQSLTSIGLNQKKGVDSECATQIIELSMKTLHKVISVKQILYQIQYSRSFLCPICGSSPKSIEHALFFCDHSKATWLAGPLSLCFDNIGGPSFFGWWNGIAGDGSPFSMENIALIAHPFQPIWITRNDCDFIGVLHNPNSILNRAVMAFQE